MKESSNTTGNQTRDLLVFSAVLQPLRAPNHKVVLAIILLLRPGYEWADLNFLQKDDISASLSAPNLPVPLTCVKTQESTHPSL
jgi:hypothetical protein